MSVHAQDLSRDDARLPTYLWADDVADAVTDEKGSAGQLFLRVAGDVAADHREAHREADGLERTEPECNQTAPFLSRDGQLSRRLQAGQNLPEWVPVQPALRLRPHRRGYQ